MFYDRNDTQEKNDKIYCSLGNYCKTSMLLKDNKLKYESYPFDWMVTCIENIIHILQDDFKEFLNKNNYVATSRGTKNSFYIKKTQELFPEIQSDHMHHNLFNSSDYEYLERCVNRFKDLHKYDKIVFIMIQPLYKTNSSINDDKINKLYNLLYDFFGTKLSLLVFPITKKNNLCFTKKTPHGNLFIYELQTQIIKGPHGMEYFDKKGIQKFLELITEV